MRTAGPVQAAAFSGAGAVAVDGSIRLTNVGVRLEPAALREGRGRRTRRRLVNDFGAIATAIPHLPPESLAACGGGAPVAGMPVAVLGPGTGPRHRDRVRRAPAAGSPSPGTAAMRTSRRSTTRSSRSGSGCVVRTAACRRNRC